MLWGISMNKVHVFISFSTTVFFVKSLKSWWYHFCSSFFKREFMVRILYKCNVHASLAITDFVPRSRSSTIRRRSQWVQPSGESDPINLRRCMHIYASFSEINLRLRSEVETLEKNPVLRSASSVKFPRSRTYDRCAGLIGFAKLITRIYISPVNVFLFFPSPSLRPCLPTAACRGRIILVEKFVITLTISPSRFLFLALWLVSSPFHSDCSHCVTPLRLGRHGIVPVVVPCRRQQPRHG